MDQADEEIIAHQQRRLCLYNPTMTLLPRSAKRRHLPEFGLGADTCFGVVTLTEAERIEANLAA
ncbi:hypothetical protein [Microvirga sp. VF16]|uniref:hypothetical protein n=1 Tax=Microvirga sp. VF16 TaxID=2807101 RepID=UPI00193E9A02|nr:hypothetical protein [Microvirga sp. VF16]QRM33675.1 hypothetical protein JO965_37330 [Microvirga sp. VF16]